MGLIEEEEGQGGDDSHYGSQAHAFQLHRAEDDGGAREAGDHGDRGKDQVSGFRVIYPFFNEHTDTGSSDETEEEDAHAAHDRGGDGVNEGGDFADEGEQNGKASSTADDPGAVYAGHGHDAHIFPIGRIWRRTDEARNHIGQAVGEEGPMEPWVLDQVAAYDITGDEKMADVFCQHHEEGWENHHDGRYVEMGRIERRESKPWHFFYVRKIHHAHENRQDVASDDADQNRDDGNKTTSQHSSQDGYHQGEHGNGDGRSGRHALRFPDEARHGHGKRCQFQTDDGYDSAHGSGRK